jgi:transcriptional regulator with XRE-family HTH domain
MAAPRLTFAELVYRILIAEKRWTLEEVAEGLGMTYATLYGRVRDRVRFSPDEATDLIRAAPDIRFAAHLLDGTPFIAIDRVSSDTKLNYESLQHGATHTVLEAADIVRTVEGEIREKLTSPQAKARIMKEIDEAERALASLRHLLQNS